MNMLDKLMLAIYTFCIGILSIVLILFPFDNIGFLSDENLNVYLQNMKGEFVFSVIGVAFLLVSIRFFLLVVKGRENGGEKESYIIKYNNVGEVKISSQTIEGLVQSVADKFSGIRNVKNTVDISEGNLSVRLKGEVSSEINIPQMSEELQKKVKEHIEECTGVPVNEVKIEISNVTTASRVVK